MRFGSIAEATAALRGGDTTAVALAEEALAAVEATESVLSAYAVVDRNGALAAASAIDAALAAGRDPGPLAGVPVAIKDIVHMKGLPTRCGSPAYPADPRPRDAAVVERLRRAGAVIVGKTTAHELACGVYSAPAANPWDPDRIPGGSSGGSGAAVAAGSVLMALGSDTGGSIRIPAALCGVAGFKPTYGLVPTDGVEALSWSLDHIGPLAATVADCAVTTGVMAGDAGGRLSDDGFDARLGEPVAALRLGVVDGYFATPAQPGVAAACQAAYDTLADLGADVVPVAIPALEHVLAAEFGIVGPEAAAFHRDLLRSRPELIDPGILALLLAGAALPADQYLKALQARRAIAAAMRAAFRNHRLDAVISPTLPATAAGKDDTVVDLGGEEMDVTLAYVKTTAPFNLTGQPALSVPCGFDETGLPVGLQIATRPYADAVAFQVGAAFEAAVPEARRRPPVHGGGA